MDIKERVQILKERVQILKEITGELKENNWLGFTSDDAKEKILISVYLDYIQDVKLEQEYDKITPKQKDFLESAGIDTKGVTKTKASEMIGKLIKEGR